MKELIDETILKIGLENNKGESLSLKLNIDNPWKDADGKEYSNEFIKNEIIEYVELGGKIYVGTDSMLFPDKCNFAAVIAFHDRDLNIARYYYKKIKSKSLSYRELQTKILEEVSLAIKVAQFVLNVCPKADVELHIDIGTNKKINATAKFFKMIHGWVTGTGFDLKVKPNSWASSLADSHTKRK